MGSAALLKGAFSDEGVVGVVLNEQNDRPSIRGRKHGGSLLNKA
jgi:hypothetical protein